MFAKNKVSESLIEAVNKVIEKNVEQIDELSKSTLGSYAKKASFDATIKRKIGGDFEHMAKTSRKPDYKDAATRQADKWKDMARQRKAGVEKAIDRLSKEEVEQMDEGGMPSSVIKNKQRNANMSDKDFANAHKDKSDADLKSMAWRHGYGKDSNHYVDRRNRGQQGVQEDVGSLHEDPHAAALVAGGLIGAGIHGAMQAADKAKMAYLYHGYGKSRMSVYDRLSGRRSARQGHEDKIEKHNNTLNTSKDPKEIEHAKSEIQKHQAELKKLTVRKALSMKEGAESVEENAFTDYKTDKKPSIFAAKSHTAKKTSTGTVYTKNWSKKDQEHKPDEKKVKNEAVDKEAEKHVRVDGETDMNTKTVDMLRGRVKVPADYHNKTKSYKVGLTVGEEVVNEAHPDEKEDKELIHKEVPKIVKKDALKKTDEAFKGPEAGSGVGDHPFVTSEAKPLKNARALAKATMGRLKNEMLGKLAN
jgi:hypothetical protein